MENGSLITIGTEGFLLKNVNESQTAIEWADPADETLLDIQLPFMYWLFTFDAQPCK